MLAGVPQVSRKTFWCLRESRKPLGKLFGVCGNPANVSANAAVLAQPAQTSRQMPRNLRGLRKRLGKCCGTCAACANVLANAAVLAQPAQTSRQMPRNLRGLRKRLGKCRGTCAEDPFRPVGKIYLSLNLANGFLYASINNVCIESASLKKTAESMPFCGVNPALDNTDFIALGLICFFHPGNPI